jgi:Cu+-exporting ATPase
LAWGGLKKRFLNIDLPIVLALFITFGRSLYEMFTHSGPGYFDSLTGIVFFMLLGRYLQDKTYESLSFSRDYTSYFPLSAHVWKEGKELWGKCDAWITDNKIVLDNCPEDKTVIKFNTKYNGHFTYKKEISKLTEIQEPWLNYSENTTTLTLTESQTNVEPETE